MHLTAEERAQLCDDGVPFPAVVWAALWLAILLAALPNPDFQVAQEPAQMAQAAAAPPPPRMAGTHPESTP